MQNSQKAPRSAPFAVLAACLSAGFISLSMGVAGIPSNEAPAVRANANGGAPISVTVIPAMQPARQASNEGPDVPEGLDGGQPFGGIIRGANGCFYGTTSHGGAHGNGNIFVLDYALHLHYLHQFDAGDPNDNGGVMNSTDPLTDIQGHLYGIIAGTLPGDDRNAFKVDYNGKFTLEPRLLGARLTLGRDGMIYGCSKHGGQGSNGCLFRIGKAGGITILHTFDVFLDPAGDDPASPVVQGPDGTLYGTTGDGAGGGFGSIYKINRRGKVTVLHAFSPMPGKEPGNSDAATLGDLVWGPDGNLYGYGQDGGANDTGAIFRITPGGAYTELHTFGKVDLADRNADGDEPTTITFAHDGSIRGVTSMGGPSGGGVIFEMTRSGVFRILHAFDDDDDAGTWPEGPIVMLPNGSILGTTSSGGKFGCGAVYTLSPAGELSIIWAFREPDDD